MNAPNDRHLDPAQLELLPLASLTPSDTSVQARRRSRFTDAAIAELAESIRSVGLAQPILVRPLGAGGYEIIAGERRWRAAQAAGLATVPCVIREIPDAEVIPLQLTENLQRETLHPLDEAEGYRALMDGGLTADQVVERCGISRRQVFARLKLLRIEPEVQRALEAGTIDVSRAMLLARVPGAKLQKKALKAITEPPHGGEPLSYRRCAELLRERFMVSLVGVPFSVKDKTLPPHACTACEHYSVNDAELQAEIAEAEGAGAQFCLNTPCHDAKVKEAFNRRREAALNDGRKVIEGEEAKALRPGTFQYAGIDGYLDLDAECAEIEEPEDATADWRPPTYRELLTKDGGAVEPDALFIDPHSGTPLDVIEEKRAAKLLKARGVKYHVERSAPTVQPTPEEIEAERRSREAAEARLRLELAVRGKVLRLVYDKWKGPLKREDLARLADEVYGNRPQLSQAADEILGEEPKFEKMTEAELARLIAMMVFDTERTPARLFATAKRYRIDVAKIRKQVKAEQEAAGA